MSMQYCIQYFQKYSYLHHLTHQAKTMFFNIIHVSLFRCKCNALTMSFKLVIVHSLFSFLCMEIYTWIQNSLKSDACLGILLVLFLKIIKATRMSIRKNIKFDVNFLRLTLRKALLLFSYDPYIFEFIQFFVKC